MYYIQKMDPLCPHLSGLEGMDDKSNKYRNTFLQAHDPTQCERMEV
jgi:hypothetical protein